VGSSGSHTVLSRSRDARAEFFLSVFAPTQSGLQPNTDTHTHVFIHTLPPTLDAQLPSWSSDTNDAAGHARTSIARRQGVCVATTAQVILVGMDNKSAANHRGGTNQLHQAILNVNAGDAVSTRFDVAYTQ
jgi:hypothetical protein